MGDWDASLTADLGRLHPVIGTSSPYCLGGQLQLDGDAWASGTWPTANKAIYVPFSIPRPYRIRRLWWQNGTAVAGNVDCAVLSRTGARIISTGSTAQAGTSAPQTVSVATTVINAGSYYFALACSSTSATIIQANTGTAKPLNFWGVSEQTSALPIPDPAVFATAVATLIPLCGMADVTTI